MNYDFHSKKLSAYVHYFRRNNGLKFLHQGLDKIHSQNFVHSRSTM